MRQILDGLWLTRRHGRSLVHWSSSRTSGSSTRTAKKLKSQILSNATANRLDICIQRPETKFGIEYSFKPGLPLNQNPDEFWFQGIPYILGNYQPWTLQILEQSTSYIVNNQSSWSLAMDLNLPPRNSSILFKAMCAVVIYRATRDNSIESAYTMNLSEQQLYVIYKVNVVIHK